MKEIIDFIKDFSLSNLGQNSWIIVSVVIIAVMIGDFLIKKYVTSTLSPSALRVQKIFKTFIDVLVYTVIGFYILSKILNRNYIAVFVLVFIFFLKSWDYWLGKYDRFVDKMINKQKNK